MTESKIMQWFETLNKKIENNSQMIMGLRERMEELFNFIETHQTDIQLLKSSFRDIDHRLHKVENHTTR